jgi:predicted DNA-binding transcriptional regulator AlpA
LKGSNPSKARATFVDLPDIMTPDDVRAYTGLGRNTVYELMNAGVSASSDGIPSKRIGQKLVTTKFALRKFLGIDVELASAGTLEVLNG